jgi:chaperonin GroEL (HSP60 family)
VIIAGELLKKAEVLLDMEIHPTIVAMGYRQAAEKAQEILNVISIDAEDRETLLKVAMTARQEKTEKAENTSRKLVVGAVKQGGRDGEIYRNHQKSRRKTGT